MLAYPPLILLVDIPVDGVVNVHNRFPVFQRKSEGGINAILQRFYCRMLPDHPLRILIYNAFHQLRQILVIIIKGIAVHATFIYNIPNGNLAQRLLVQ